MFFTNNYWRYTGTAASYVAYNPGDETVTGPLVRPSSMPINNGATPPILNALEDWKYEDGNYTMVKPGNVTSAVPLDIVNWSKEGTDYTTVIYLPEFAQSAGFPAIVSIDLRFSMNFIEDTSDVEIMDKTVGAWSVVIDFASCIAVTSIQPSRLSSQGNFFAAAAWAYGKLLDFTNPSVKITVKSKWIERGSNKQAFPQQGVITGDLKVEPYWPSPTSELGAFCAHCHQRRSTPLLTSSTG